MAYSYRPPKPGLIQRGDHDLRALWILGGRMCIECGAEESIAKEVEKRYSIQARPHLPWYPCDCYCRPCWEARRGKDDA